MLNWTEIRTIIEKNGLMIFCSVIILFYWTVDIITKGSLANRILITILMLAYGIMTQYLITKQKKMTDSLTGIMTQYLIDTQKTMTASLTQKPDPQGLENEELSYLNKKLELAYTYMQDGRDELIHQIYEEDIGFLLDEAGKIEGVTERALTVFKKSRDALVGIYLIQLMPKNACEEFERELRQAWEGVAHKLKSRIIIPGGEEQEFEMKFTRFTVSGKKLLLIILNRQPSVLSQK